MSKNLQPQQPKKVRLPTEIAEHFSLKIRAELRKIQRYYNRNQVTREQAKQIGVLNLIEAFDEQIQKILEFLEKNQLSIVGVREGLEIDLRNAIDGWKKIVDHF